MLFLRSFFGRMAAVLVLAAATACSSSDGSDPTPDASREMSWTVDGAALNTTTLQSQKGSTTVSVAGTVANGSTISYLSLEIPNAVGTYAFGPTSAAAATYSTTSGSTNVVYYAGATGLGTVSGAGTIVVTALTATNVAGTFTFTGVNPNTGASKSVANGKFNVGL